MPQLPSITPRSARALIGLLLGMKLALSIWNAAVFDGKTLDADFHADRALFGGLRASASTHDGPIYYLPALLRSRPGAAPRELRATAGEEGETLAAGPKDSARQSRSERAFRGDLLDFLRYTNVLWLGLFYAVWIYEVFPRVLPGSRRWFLASLALLALPGFQRLGVLSHPDNAAVGLLSLAVWAWLHVRERARAAPELAAAAPPAEVSQPSGSKVSLADLALFGLAVGVTAAARSFAAAPAAVLGVVAVSYAWRSAEGDWRKALPRALMVAGLAALLSLAWSAHRQSAIRAADEGGAARYFPAFEANRAGFGYARYFTSFRAGELLDGDESEREQPAALAPENSFFTLLYADTWGDQWRAFSSPRSKEDKKWPKLIMLGAALPTIPIATALGVAALLRLARRIRRAAAERAWAGLSELEPELVLLAVVLAGAATFVWWQVTRALLPDDNSTVKFIYVASLVPPALALLFRREPSAWTFRLLSGYGLALFALAFPLVMYWPR